MPTGIVCRSMLEVKASANRNSFHAVMKQNTAVAAGVLRRQFTAPAVNSERVFVCIVAGTTALAAHTDRRLHRVIIGRRAGGCRGAAATAAAAHALRVDAVGLCPERDDRTGVGRIRRGAVAGGTADAAHRDGDVDFRRLGPLGVVGVTSGGLRLAEFRIFPATRPPSPGTFADLADQENAVGDFRDCLIESTRCQYVDQHIEIGYGRRAAGRGTGLAGGAAAAANALHRQPDRVGAPGHDAAAVGYGGRVAVPARPAAAANANGDRNLAAIRRGDATTTGPPTAADALDEHASRPVAPCRHGTAVGQADDAGMAARAAAATRAAGRDGNGDGGNVWVG